MAREAAHSIDEGSDVHELIAARLRRVDQRYTAGRRAIVDALQAMGYPGSISDIGDQLPELPRSSAYRHLVDLQKAGVVRRLATGDEFARFELAEDLTEHHHHLLCTGCGRVIDVTPTLDFEQMVSRMVDQLAAQEGFEATSHALDVAGHCSDCIHPPNRRE